jgi:importin subunit beta-1
MDLVQMLSAIQQGDNATRQQAEQFMKQAEESQTAPFMAALVAELGKEEQTVIIRQQAGLYFKNMLHAEDDGIREAKEARWRDSIDDGTKVAVRSGLLQCLLSPQEQVRSVAAQGIGAVAAIDLPSKQWTGDTGVVAQILQCVTAPEGSVPETAKQAALKACGYMCEELEEEHLDETQRNQILTAIVDGIKVGVEFIYLFLYEGVLPPLCSHLKMHF